MAVVLVMIENSVLANDRRGGLSTVVAGIEL